MSLIKVKELLKFEKEEGLKKRFSRFKYAFEPGTEFDEYPGLRFWGFIPDEDFGEFLFTSIEKLKVKKWNLDIVLMDGEEFSKITKHYMQPIEKAIETGMIIGEREEVEKMLEAIHARRERFADVYTPKGARKNKRGLLAVNLDSIDPKGGLFEGLLHYLTDEEGWLDTLHQVHEKMYEASVVTNIEYEIVENIRENIGDIFCSEMAVRKGFKEFAYKKAIEYLDNTIKENSEDELKKLSNADVGSFLFAIDVYGQSTLPPSYPEREKVKEKEIEPRRNKLMKYAYPKVKENLGKIDEAFYSLEIPPKKENIKKSYFELFDVYLSL